ncbi:MAG: hypothetical protein FMNOHCHN_03644 [Ignavibacteriaceae bacterium]|nr:hypothetical protein [Ignavibacteriaceae bacterium]
MGKEKLKEICADCGTEVPHLKTFVIFAHYKSGKTNRIQTRAHSMPSVVRDFFADEDITGIKALDVLEV